MKETTKTPKQRVGKKLLCVLIVIGFIAGWYTVVRLMSKRNVVKSIILHQKAVAAPTKTIQTLRVGCYNIAHGRGGGLDAANWEGGNQTTKKERLKKIAHVLKTAQLDIVVLNEVDFSSFWSGHVDQAQLIAREGGYPYFIEQRNVDVAIPFCRIQFGNVVLSKYPISGEQLVDFPNESKLIEILVGGLKEGLVCTVQLPDTSHVRIFAVHLAVNSEAVRVASARTILDVQQNSDIPLIALGDFNTTQKGYPKFHVDKDGNNAIEILLDSQRFTTLPLGLPVSPQDFTFPSEKPERVIDWIFVSSPWQLREKHVLSEDLSDHLPVVALLTR